jgi:hypothetical protein
MAGSLNRRVLGRRFNSFVIIHLLSGAIGGGLAVLAVGALATAIGADRD